MIDAEPLIRYVESCGGFGKAIRTQDENVRRVWLKIKKNGRVSIACADQFCIKHLKVNPAVVFGQAWWETNDYKVARRGAA